ncbi:MAG TPA: collagen-like protein [Candidatus Gemmiger excrementigallinarum]|uniref:Collagen-like protein n=1 Tax=Candidatus Gemmiger excrementigallinarum TaxID=2838609 RepID=A0A9D2JA60_9FIRM|nr:collagen-like protein [Candidatus Gemmiger excrementigallinarum]
MNRIVIPSLLLATMLLSACGADTTDKIQMQVSDGYIQYFNGESWENLVALEELRGPQGEQGPAGQPGKDGKDGVDGKDGEDGQDGLSGSDGKDGKDGIDGQDGRNGRDGIDGESYSECEHLFKKTSEGSKAIEDYGDGTFLYRRTETWQCEKCGKMETRYMDFESSPLPTPFPTPTPVPDEEEDLTASPTPNEQLEQ